MILCSNPGAQYRAHKAEVDAAIQRVLNNGWFVLGQEVEKFEAEFSAYIGTSHSIGVGSGTESLHLALAACGIGSGDEVITVSHTAVATMAAIELTGATPVLVDIEPDDYTLDPEKLGAAITSRTKVILPVHLYGQPNVERGIGAGVSSFDAGLRIRYELRREFAPYLGVTWHRRFGETAGFAEAAGESTGGRRFVAGLRLWF